MLSHEIGQYRAMPQVDAEYCPFWAVENASEVKNEACVPLLLVLLA